MHTQANHKDDLTQIAHGLMTQFAGTVKGSKVLNILKKLETAVETDLIGLEIAIEDLFEGTPEFDAYMDSTDYIKAYAPFFNFTGGVCRG